MPGTLTPLPGNDVLLGSMKRMRDRGADMEPAMLAIMVSFHAIEQARFDNEGPGWVALKESTVASRIALGYGSGPILFRSGDLEASFTGGASSTNIASAGFMEVTSQIDYAHFHQDGVGRNPQRKIIDLNVNTLALWREILQGYLSSGSTGSLSDDAIAMAL